MSTLPDSLARFGRELEDAIRHDLRANATVPSTAWGPRVLLAIRRRPGRTTVALAVVVGATAAALFVSSPWRTAPSLGFLEDVQAALTPPPGAILHMKWEHIVTSEDPACTSTGGHEVWIDLTSPHAYRAFVPAGGAIPETPGTASPPLPDPPTGGLPCPPTGTPVEVGGVLDGEDSLRFVPPNTLARARRLHFAPQDHWAFVRQMISEGRAHREGKRELDGRIVERVRLDPPAACPAEAAGHCPTEPEYAYFDPETLYPVAWDYARDPTFPLVRQRERYLAYEYLPQTDDNIALTDIRAQHPDAIER